MEKSIKLEPPFYEEHTQCCFLCHDGQQLFGELVRHFRASHGEDYNQLPDDSIVQLCSCPDAIQLQFRLLNHMLSKSLPPKDAESPESVEITVKVELCEEDASSSTKRRRRRRKRSQLLECDHCGMQFSAKNALQRHMLRHRARERPPTATSKGKEKRTLCQHCSMWISFYNLKRHIRTSHSDNKHIYECDFEGCTKRFTESQNLKDHKNSHLGLRPYICEYCSKSFERIASLRRHKYRHTDPEKYKCSVCEECFVNNKTLSNHVQRQHREINNDAKPYACDYEGCNSAFKYENYLQNHKRDVHVRKRTRVRVREAQRINFFDHTRPSLKS